MRDILCDHVRGNQMCDGASFAAMRSKLKRVQTASSREKICPSQVHHLLFTSEPSKLIQGEDIGVHVELGERSDSGWAAKTLMRTR